MDLEVLADCAKLLAGSFAAGMTVAIPLGKMLGNREGLDPVGRLGPGWFDDDVTVSQDALPLECYLLAHSRINNKDNHPHHYECRHTAREIHDLYLDIARRSGREDLSDDIRVCVGYPKRRPFAYGHAWVEIMHEGSWLPLETTQPIEKMPYDVAKGLVRKDYSFVKYALAVKGRFRRTGILHKGEQQRSLLLKHLE